MTRVLLVCLGNICRSPTAEAVLRKMADLEGVDLSVDSAGTGDWHIGKPPYGPAIETASSKGYDLTQLRARQVRAADFEAFDLILAMDRDNLSSLEAMRPPGSGARLGLFLDGAEVPDPYFTRDFEGALARIEMGARALLDQLRQKDSAVRPKLL